MATLIAVGQEYPFHNIADGTDKGLVELTEVSFNFICYLSGAQPHELVTFREGRLHYGIYTHSALDALPLLVFDFNQLFQFDATINLQKQDSLPESAHWLASNGNVVMLILVDARTNVVLGLRALGMSLDYMMMLRLRLADQATYYENADAVHQAYQALLQQVDSKQVMAEATYYQAGDPTGQALAKYTLPRA